MSPDCQSGEYLQYSTVQYLQYSKGYFQYPFSLDVWEKRCIFCTPGSKFSYRFARQSDCMGLNFCFLASASTLACSRDQPKQLWFTLVISGRDICGASDSENMLILKRSCYCTRLLWEQEELNMEIIYISDEKVWEVKVGKGFSHFFVLYSV